MRTGLRFKAVLRRSTVSSSMGTDRCATVPAATVHQPSIRAQATAHDVSIRSSTITSPDRRGWASQSMSRSWWTINHPENARTGPSALGTVCPSARGLHGRRGDGMPLTLDASGAAAAPELAVVDLVTEHDVEPNEQFAREGHLRLGAAPPMQYGEVPTLELAIGPRGERGGLSQDPAQKSVALLGDLAKMVFVRRGINGRRQTDVAHDVLAGREAGGRPQDQNGDQGGQRTNTRMREQQLGPGIGRGCLHDTRVELVDAGREPGE